jgi:hypothetical protein
MALWLIVHRKSEVFVSPNSFTRLPPKKSACTPIFLSGFGSLDDSARKKIIHKSFSDKKIRRPIIKAEFRLPITKAKQALFDSSEFLIFVVDSAKRTASERNERTCVHA